MYDLCKINVILSSERNVCEVLIILVERCIEVGFIELKVRFIAQLVKALHWHCRGHRFESH